MKTLLFGIMDSHTGAVQQLGHLSDLRAFQLAPTMVDHQIHIFGRDSFGRNALYVADARTGEFLRKVLYGSNTYHIIGPVQRH